MDGERYGAPRSTDNDTTAAIPRLPVDHPGQAGYEQTQGIEPGWYDRMRADVAGRDAERPGGPMWSWQDDPRGSSQRRLLAAVDPDEPNRVPTHYPRHQAPKDDLPGPSRRELARLVRQVRALAWVAIIFHLAGYVSLWYLIR